MNPITCFEQGKECVWEPVVEDFHSQFGFGNLQLKFVVPALEFKRCIHCGDEIFPPAACKRTYRRADELRPGWRLVSDIHKYGYLILSTKTGDRGDKVRVGYLHPKHGTVHYVDWDNRHSVRLCHTF